MRAPRRISPAARARRTLLVDLVAAVLLAAVVLQLASGLGVIGFFGLPILLLGLLWVALERLRSISSIGAGRPPKASTPKAPEQAAQAPRPNRLLRVPCRQVEVKEGAAERDVGDQEGEDDRAKDVDPGE